MREVQSRMDSGDTDAQLAEALFVYRAKKYLGAYFAVLGNVDAIIFTGGIGEHSARIREQICANLQGLGIGVDSNKNQQRSKQVMPFHSDTASVQLLVIPTNEELAIARSTAALIA